MPVLVPVPVLVQVLVPVPAQVLRPVGIHASSCVAGVCRLVAPPTYRSLCVGDIVLPPACAVSPATGRGGAGRVSEGGGSGGGGGAAHLRVCAALFWRSGGGRSAGRGAGRAANSLPRYRARRYNDQGGEWIVHVRFRATVNKG